MRLRKGLVSRLRDVKISNIAETRQYQPIPTTFTPEFFKRYTDYVNNEDAVRSLIQGAISLVKKVIKKRGLNDLEVILINYADKVS